MSIDTTLCPCFQLFVDDGRTTNGSEAQRMDTQINRRRANTANGRPEFSTRTGEPICLVEPQRCSAIGDVAHVATSGYRIGRLGAASALNGATCTLSR